LAQALVFDWWGVAIRVSLSKGYGVAHWVDSKVVGGVSELTLLTPIKQGAVPGESRIYEQRLADELESVQRRIDAGRPTPIMRIPTIHFARWLILVPGHYLHYDPDAVVVGHQYRSWLLFTSNFDGDLKTYLNDFSAVLGEDVDRIWENCEGYPVEGSRNFDAYWAYAKKHQLTTQAFYNAYPNQTVARVHELVTFRRLFDAFVAETRRPEGTSIEDLPAAFDRFLASTSTFPQNFPSRGGIYDPSSAACEDESLASDA
jgi:hypothetical protein